MAALNHYRSFVPTEENKLSLFAINSFFVVLFVVDKRLRCAGRNFLFSELNKDLAHSARRLQCVQEAVQVLDRSRPAVFLLRKLSPPLVSAGLHTQTRD